MPRQRRQDPSLQTLLPIIDAFFGLDPRQQMVALAAIALLVIGVAIFLFQNRQHFWPGSSATATPHLLLGNPSNAASSVFNENNYLMVKPGYALSYNDANGTPNWVSWRLLASDCGSAPRKPEFDQDLELPASFYRVTMRDYSGSGFDRGHMCPHGDRAATIESSYGTFIMSNVIPQAPNVNRKAWAQLEEYCRRLARDEHDHLYIICGPLGQGGTGHKGFAQTIAHGRVIVPAECWKVVVVVPEGFGGDDLSRIDAHTRVITVEMPNDQDRVDEPWAPFRTSAAEVERKTGYHFFTALSPPIAQALERQVDDRYIPPPEPLRHATD